MKATNESSCNLAHDSGSTKRLDSYKTNLLREDLEPLFDPRAKEVLLAYAKNPKEVERIIQYLDNLVDADGVKFGRSIRQPEKMNEIIESFQRPEKSSFRWNVNYQHAVKSVKERYSKAHLKFLTYHSDDDISEVIKDKTTSTGMEGIISGRRKKGEVLDGSLTRLEVEENLAKKVGSFNKLILLATRTQCSGEFNLDGTPTGTCKHKTRPVNMVDVWVVISELKFVNPLNKWIKGYRYSSIGKDDRSLTSRVNSLRFLNHSYISLDYSKYDSTIPSWLLHDAFDVVRCAFDVYDEELLSVLEEDFINKNLLLSDGIIHVTHGNPSGSGFTSLINGICNEIITETWAKALGYHVDYTIMGDDNLIYFKETLERHEVEEICSYITHNFGIVTNSDKTTSGNSDAYPEYMSREWRPNGPYRSMQEIVSHILYPERFRDYAKHPEMTPELVVYSYLLAYPANIESWFRRDDFLRETKLGTPDLRFSKEVITALPWNIRSGLINGGSDKLMQSIVLNAA